MEYDFYDAVEKRYDLDYSYGGKVERSFWKNVGNIVNKKTVFEKNDTMFSKIIKAGDDFIEGKKWNSKQK